MRSLELSPQRISRQLNRSGLGYIGLGLIVLHLLMTWKFTGNSDQLLLSGIFWATIAMLLWQKRPHLRLRSHWFGATLGLFLLAVSLSKSLSLTMAESEFVRFFPGLVSLGLALVASGWQLWQYRREACLVGILMIPPGAIGRIMDWTIGLSIQKLIAQSATFLLHYLGTTALRDGTSIFLKSGAVNVEYACTGVPILLLLVQLSGLMGIAFAIKQSQKVLMISLATSLAWLLATIRVAVMAVVVAQPEAFEYWHGSAGGQIFSTGAIIVFALICQQFPSVKKALS